MREGRWRRDGDQLNDELTAPTANRENIDESEELSLHSMINLVIYRTISSC